MNATSQNSQTVSASTEQLPGEEAFERFIPKTGSIQDWAGDVFWTIQNRPYEIADKHRLEQWLIKKVAEHHPHRTVGAIRWLTLMSLPEDKDAELRPWANDAYRIITTEGLCASTEQQEAALLWLRTDLLARGVTNEQYARWFLSKTEPRQPKRPDGLRKPIPNAPRPQKPRTLPKPHVAKAPVVKAVVNCDDYRPGYTEIEERLTTIKETLNDDASWDPEVWRDAARQQLIAEHRAAMSKSSAAA